MEKRRLEELSSRQGEPQVADVLVADERLMACLARFEKRLSPNLYLFTSNSGVYTPPPTPPHTHTSLTCTKKCTSHPSPYTPTHAHTSYMYPIPLPIALFVSGAKDYSRFILEERNDFLDLLSAFPSCQPQLSKLIGMS